MRSGTLSGFTALQGVSTVDITPALGPSRYRIEAVGGVNTVSVDSAR